jgi:peptidoglycan/xylan/chitin deacetylase (PgdA/CDA1 family)
MELVANHFNVLPLSTAARLLRTDQLPGRAICITFDDGYADNVEVALPILIEHKLTAAFFIATDFLDGGRMWNDTVIETIRNMPSQPVDLSDIDLGTYDLTTIAAKRACIDTVIKQIKHCPQEQRQELAEKLAEKSPYDLPDNLMMRREQVRQLQAAGMEIGGHTVTHPILATLERDAAIREIIQGKEILEEIIGEDLKLFAYPNGKPGVDYLPEHVEMVRRSGFEAAVSTVAGISEKRTNPHELRRFTPWDNTPNRFLLRLVKNYLIK